MHRHIPTAILLLLMIVLFVAMDETLLPQLLTALAFDVGVSSSIEQFAKAFDAATQG